MNPPPDSHSAPRDCIYHLLAQADWNKARAAGVYAPANLAVEGFIHCSTLTQLATVAERYFAGRNDVLIMRINPARLKAQVRYELSEPGERYPHLYGAVDLDAVIELRTLRFRADGHAELPSRWQAAAGGLARPGE